MRLLSKSPSRKATGQRRSRSNKETGSTKKLTLTNILALGIPIVAVEFALVYYHFVQPFRKQQKSSTVAWNPPPVYQGLKENAASQTDDKSNSSASSPFSSKKIPPPDGYFNGYPIYHHDITAQKDQNGHLPFSQLHCIGETNAEPVYWKRRKVHLDMGWAYRSCHFQFMCMDLEKKDFVLFPSPQDDESLIRNTNEKELQFEAQQTWISNTSVHGFPFGVSIGGINGKWNNEGIPRLQWFPRVDRSGPPDQFYTLPANVTLVPFHSLAASNPGHLMWDDFLPIYTLMHIFGLTGEDLETAPMDLLMLRYQLPGEGLWASCDWKPIKQEECAAMLKKFGPLVVRPASAFPITTQNNVNLTLLPNNNEMKKDTKYICAKHSLAGLGALTDHGVSKGHGWEERDYFTTYNHGRGGQLWRFRNFMLSNLGLDQTLEIDGDTLDNLYAPPSPPFHIIFSERSSRLAHRSIDFTKEIKMLKEVYANATDVLISSYQMKGLTLHEQAQMVSRASIYVTGCGGGAATATFLPKGSATIIYFSEAGGVENNRASGKPARLDWDFFNNLAYSRVHWITRRSLHLSLEMESVFHIIEHELTRQRDQWANYIEGQKLKSKSP